MALPTAQTYGSGTRAARQMATTQPSAGAASCTTAGAGHTTECSSAPTRPGAPTPTEARPASVTATGGGSTPTGTPPATLTGRQKDLTHNPFPGVAECIG